MEPNARLAGMMYLFPEVVHLLSNGVRESSLVARGIGEWDPEQPTVYGNYLVVPMVPSQPRLYQVYLLQKSWEDIVEDIHNLLAQVQ